MRRETEVAFQAVREAASLCMSVSAHTPAASDVVQKEDASPVTIADFGSQALVCRRLGQAFPEDGIVAEEDAAVLREKTAAPARARLLRAVQEQYAGTTMDDVLRWIDLGAGHGHDHRYWTLDPIDGTKGYIRGGQYVVALALIADGEVEIGALACPNLTLPGMTSPGVIVTAEKGGGAWSWSLQEATSLGKLHVSKEKKNPGMRFCESVESAHSAHGRSARIAADVGIGGSPVRMDSQAKYAAVAAGMAEIYLRLPVSVSYVENIWDHAAGCLIVEEAGGRVTDMHGQRLDFSRGAKLSANEGIVASHGIVHDRLIQSIQTHS